MYGAEDVRRCTASRCTPRSLVYPFQLRQRTAHGIRPGTSSHYRPCMRLAGTREPAPLLPTHRVTLRNPSPAPWEPGPSPPGDEPVPVLVEVPEGPQQGVLRLHLAQCVGGGNELAVVLWGGDGDGVCDGGAGTWVKAWRSVVDKRHVTVPNTQLPARNGGSVPCDRMAKCAGSSGRGRDACRKEVAVDVGEQGQAGAGACGVQEDDCATTARRWVQTCSCA